MMIKDLRLPALAPSLLSADFSSLENAIKQIEENGGSVVHIDVMDGQFVSEITYGQPVIRAFYQKTYKTTVRCTFNGRKSRKQNRQFC